MNVVLFDHCSSRREAWEKLANQQSVSLHCFDAISEQAIVSIDSPRVIIVDQSVVEDCLAAVQRIIPKLRTDLVAFSLPHYQASTVVRLLQHGAAWVFDNALTPGIIEADFTEVLRLANEFHHKFQTHRRLQAMLGKVTPAEKEVLALMLEGMPNKTIAKQLNISVRTVESRRSKIYRKCGAKSITALVRFADEAESLRIQFESQVDPASEDLLTHTQQLTDPNHSTQAANADTDQVA